MCEATRDAGAPPTPAPPRPSPVSRGATAAARRGAGRFPPRSAPSRPPPPRKAAARRCYSPGSHGGWSPGPACDNNRHQLRRVAQRSTLMPTRRRLAPKLQVPPRPETGAGDYTGGRASACAHLWAGSASRTAPQCQAPSASPPVPPRPAATHMPAAAHKGPLAPAPAAAAAAAPDTGKGWGCPRRRAGGAVL